MALRVSSFLSKLALARGRFLLGLYLLAGIIAGVVSFALDQSKNLEVFRHASQSLLAHRDLYDGSSVDWYKYSPSFALIFLPLALAPAWVAAAVWGAANFGVAFAGIHAMTGADPRGVAPGGARNVALLAALPGVLLATDGDQANLLVAGLMLLACSAFARNRSIRGAALVILGFLVKIFPLGAVLFALLDRERERNLFRVIVAMAIGLLLPLIVIHPSELAAQYSSWISITRFDHAHNRGWSLVTLARDIGLPALSVQIAALTTLALPVIGAMTAPAPPTMAWRRAFAASLLILIVLCNHRSEYTSFVISSIGVGLWFADARRTPASYVLLALASVAHGPVYVVDDPRLTGAFSFLAAHRIYHPLRLVPLVVVWAHLQVHLVRALVASHRRGGSSSAKQESAAE